MISARDREGWTMSSSLDEEEPRRELRQQGSGLLSSEESVIFLANGKNILLELRLVAAAKNTPDPHILLYISKVESGEDCAHGVNVRGCPDWTTKLGLLHKLSKRLKNGIIHLQFIAGFPFEMLRYLLPSGNAALQRLVVADDDSQAGFQKASPTRKRRELQQVYNAGIVSSTTVDSDQHDNNGAAEDEVLAVGPGKTGRSFNSQYVDCLHLIEVLPDAPCYARLTRLLQYLLLHLRCGLYEIRLELVQRHLGYLSPSYMTAVEDTFWELLGRFFNKNAMRFTVDLGFQFGEADFKWLLDKFRSKMCSSIEDGTIDQWEVNVRNTGNCPLVSLNKFLRSRQRRRHESDTNFKIHCFRLKIPISSQNFVSRIMESVRAFKTNDFAQTLVLSVIPIDPNMSVSWNAILSSFETVLESNVTLEGLTLQSGSFCCPLTSKIVASLCLNHNGNRQRLRLNMQQNRELVEHNLNAPHTESPVYRFPKGLHHFDPDEGHSLLARALLVESDDLSATTTGAPEDGGERLGGTSIARYQRQMENEFPHWKFDRSDWLNEEIRLVYSDLTKIVPLRDGRRQAPAVQTALTDNNNNCCYNIARHHASQGKKTHKRHKSNRNQ